MAYGVLAGVISTFLMYFLLLPINSFRLFQIIKLLKKARIAVQRRSVDRLAQAVHEFAQLQERRLAV